MWNLQNYSHKCNWLYFARINFRKHTLVLYFARKENLIIFNTKFHDLWLKIDRVFATTQDSTLYVKTINNVKIKTTILKSNKRFSVKDTPRSFFIKTPKKIVFAILNSSVNELSNHVIFHQKKIPKGHQI